MAVGVSAGRGEKREREREKREKERGRETPLYILALIGFYLMIPVVVLEFLDSRIPFHIDAVFLVKQFVLFHRFVKCLRRC